MPFSSDSQDSLGNMASSAGHGHQPAQEDHRAGALSEHHEVACRFGCDQIRGHGGF